MRKITLPKSELELFKFFRVGFGLFLFSHFALLFGHLDLLFSEIHMGSDFAGFLNILSYASGPSTILAINLLACALSVCVILNFHRNIASLILLYIHSCYLHKNLMILNVSYDYLGWLLLALILIPSEKEKDWKMPSYIHICGWLIFGLGYTLNGILKMKSPVWFDGSALSLIIPHDRLLTGGLIRDILLSLPGWMLSILTWVTAYAELLCLPLMIWKPTRKFIWLVILCLHINALLIFKIKDLSLIMIFFSLFTGITLNRDWRLAIAKDRYLLARQK